MVVAHGETAVANQARHLCSGRVQGKDTVREEASKQETLLEQDKKDRDEETEGAEREEETM